MKFLTKHALSLAREWAVVVVLGVGALLACAKLAEDVFSHETTTFDGVVRSWTQAHRTHELDVAFSWITQIGAVTPMVGMSLLAALWLWRGRHRRVAALSLLAPVVATLLFTWIKMFYARPRPPAIGHVPATYAFPSGHSAASTAVCSTVAYVFYQERIISRGTALWLAIAPPLLVGLSRIYLDAHWATDVLGGWSFGLLITIAGVVLMRRHRQNETPHSSEPAAFVSGPGRS